MESLFHRRITNPKRDALHPIVTTGTSNYNLVDGASFLHGASLGLGRAKAAECLFAKSMFGRIDGRSEQISIALVGTLNWSFGKGTCAHFFSSSLGRARRLGQAFLLRLLYTRCNLQQAGGGSRLRTPLMLWKRINLANRLLCSVYHG